MGSNHDTETTLEANAVFREIKDKAMLIRVGNRTPGPGRQKHHLASHRQPVARCEGQKSPCV